MLLEGSEAKLDLLRVKVSSVEYSVAAVAIAVNAAVQTSVALCAVGGATKWVMLRRGRPLRATQIAELPTSKAKASEDRPYTPNELG